MSRALIFASFGTADAEVKKACLDPIMEDFKFEFPKDERLSVYTSDFLRKKAAAEGEMVPSLAEALDMLAFKKVTQVYIQPGFVTAGEEYQNKLQAVVDEYQDKFATLKLGQPLLTRPADNWQLLTALLADLHVPSGSELVLVGHGSPHQHNAAYESLQDHIDKEGLPIHIGVLEQNDTPDFAAVNARLQEAGAHKVLLAPLLLTCGTHVTRDIAGDVPASWQSRLQAAGYTVETSLHGLGEYTGIRKLFVQRLRDLLGE